MAIKSKSAFAKALGKRIREVRESKGLSLKHFEAMDDSPLDRHSLSRIEQGKIMPSSYTLYKICSSLKIRLAELLEGF